MDTSECVNYALDHNISIKQQELSKGLVEEDITIAKGNFYPSLNSSGFNKTGILVPISIIMADGFPETAVPIIQFKFPTLRFTRKQK